MPRYARRLPPDAARTALDPVRSADEREVAMLEGPLAHSSATSRACGLAGSRPPGGAASHRATRSMQLMRWHGRPCPPGHRRLREICIRPH